VTISAINTAGTGTGTVTVTISAGGGGGSSYMTDFEDGSKGAYASDSVTLRGISWNMTEALIGNLVNDFKVGTKSMRLRGHSTSTATMLADTMGGMGVISFQHRRYGTDTQIEWIVEYSTDGGSVWTEAGRFTAGANAATFSSTVNSGSNGRVRIRANAAGSNDRRTNIDEFSITAYSPPVSATVAASGNLSVLSASYGSASLTASSFTVSGQNLTQGIQVDPPDGFEVSLASDGASGYAATQTVAGTGTIAPTTVFIRLAAGSAAGFYSGNLVCSSGAASATLAVPEAEVRKKGLSITANNLTKMFGQTLVFGVGQTNFNSSGLVNGETVGSVTLTASGGTGANDPAGDYVLTPSAATGGTFDLNNYSAVYHPGILTVFITIQDWVAQFPGLTDNTPSGDPDGDGISNLMEYFLGLDPTEPGGSSGSVMTLTNGPSNTVSMTYRRAKGLTNVDATVQTIGDLSTTNWGTNGVQETVVDKGTHEEVTATVTNAPGETRKFMRLRVSQP
jgi:hypothetical protein